MFFRSIILSLPLIFFTFGCSIYQSHFEKGGELTTDFLNQIEEKTGGEDTLLPPKEKEKKRC